MLGTEETPYVEIPKVFEGLLEELISSINLDTEMALTPASYLGSLDSEEGLAIEHRMCCEQHQEMSLQEVRKKAQHMKADHILTVFETVCLESEDDGTPIGKTHGLTLILETYRGAWVGFAPFVGYYKIEKPQFIELPESSRRFGLTMDQAVLH